MGGVEQACQAVTYTYDSGAYAIGRLSSMQWGGAACTGGYSYTEAYAYAQPGNVLSKTLMVVNAQSQAAALAATFTYDNEGRRTQVKYPNWNDYGTPVTGPTYAYGFDAMARPASLTGDGQTWVQNVVYSVAGQITSMQYLQYTGGPAWLTETRGYNTRLQMTSQTVAPSGGYAVAEDRLGSTRRDDTTASRFFPWGEENGSTANDRQKFGTYYRDAGTGLDYANQRYYSATIGRFLTADPYRASAGPARPGNWNRYAYVSGEPVNWRDPSGLTECDPNPPYTCYESVEVPGEMPPFPIYGGGGGGPHDGGPNMPQLEVPPDYFGRQEETTAGEEAAGRPPGSNGAVNALARPDCYKLFGFGSATAAQAAFRHVTFSGPMHRI